ncbi:CaiB/BaiF CoA-transferase family protein [Streptomyces mirabilis]|uniref:CaiB/BaiF CoA-transferase family protein n=1 Tax=Streptomyces mirabilis TaxID=68239 RepID=UPI0033BE6390
MTDSTATAPLGGVGVLEWSTTIAGAYAGRLLCDAGATVTRAGGAATLGRGPEFDAYLHYGKEAVAAALEDLPSVIAAVNPAVVVLELPDAPGDDLVAGCGDAVVVAITPWGLDGPWVGEGRPWSEFTLQVEAGSLTLRGAMTPYPIMTGSSESLWVAGTMAAGAATAALQGGPAGRVIDVSLLEVTAYATNLFQDVAASVSEPCREPVPRVRLTPSVEPAADGWIGYNLASARNHEDFLVLIERPDWLADEQMRSFYGRYARMDEWTEAVRSWTRRHSVQSCVEAATAFRIPTAPVHNGRTVLDDEQVTARAFYEPHPDGGFMAPAPPFLFDGARPRRTKRGAGPAGPHPAVSDGPPFQGLRVLDLGTWWVGAYVGSALGAFGADVIKVESARRIDGSRTMGGVPVTRDHWWECGNFYLGANFDKRGITLDFTRPEGRELLIRMIEDADVLLENFAPRVLEAAGLGWDEIHRINPRLVMLRMPAFGLTGPRRELVGYAQTVEQFSGLCWRTGYPGGDPTNPQGPADPMGGANSFFALAAALLRCRATGEGMLVEAALAEGALTMAAEQVIRWTADGELLDRTGNRAAEAHIQGVFATRDTERWVGLSVLDEGQWHALVDVLGFDDWHTEPALADRAGRQAEADRIEARIAAWVKEREAGDVVDRLIAAGVPAGASIDCRWVYEHPQLAGRGAYETAELPHAGTVPLPTLPFRRLDQPAWLTRRPPTLGEHNREVLIGELGLTEEEFTKLVELKVIGTVPEGF